MIKISLELAGFLIVFLVSAGFVLGAVWRDRRALKVEKGLRGQVEIQKALIKTQAPGLSVRGVLEDREMYIRRQGESAALSREEAFNKGVVHGLNAALLRIRGWI